MTSCECFQSHLSVSVCPVHALTFESLGLETKFLYAGCQTSIPVLIKMCRVLVLRIDLYGICLLYTSDAADE